MKWSNTKKYMAHNHDLSHTPTNFGTAFAVGAVLNTGFVLAEVIYGLSSHSLALLSDAGHNAGDVAGLLLAWGAFALAKRKPSKKHTYGMRRTSILAALINAVVLLVVTGGIAWEAVIRFSHLQPVQGTVVIWVAAVGVLINTSTALMFLAGREKDLNVKGVFQHMAADAMVALGVVVAGIVILYTGWNWLDPVVSLVISIIIVLGTWGLLRDSVNLALDAVPRNINLKEVEAYLTELPGVCEVHDLHIWPMSTTETALTAHLVVEDIEKANVLVDTASHELHDRFEIEHPTIQLEQQGSSHGCHLASSEVV